MGLTLQGSVIQHKGSRTNVPSYWNLTSLDELDCVSAAHPLIIALGQASPFVAQTLEPDRPVTALENGINSLFFAIRSEDVVDLWSKDGVQP